MILRKFRREPQDEVVVLDGEVARRPVLWKVGDRVLDGSERTLVMGIVNVTPDSFSDGGRFFDSVYAVRHAKQLIADGADILDIGGESTRPGSETVDIEEEIRRVVPVVRRLVEEHPDVIVSVDTRKSEVAAAALLEGAQIVNDVSAGADPEMFDVVKGGGAAIVLMHMKGEPKTMQQDPTYDDVVGEVHSYLRERVEAAVFAGIDVERVAIDPGIGFGKTLEHNLELIRRIDAFLDLKRPVLVGPSRKRFLGTILDLPEDQRDEGTVGAVAWMVSRGAHVARVHDVRSTSRAVRVIDEIARSGR